MYIQMAAVKQQSGGGKWNSDIWGAVSLYPGQKVYGGIPGQSEYYTDEETLKEFANSPEDLWAALQVGAHPVRGFRTQVAEYDVIAPVTVPAARCTRNGIYGAGGGFQYMIVPYHQILSRTTRVIDLSGDGLLTNGTFF